MPLQQNDPWYKKADEYTDEAFRLTGLPTATGAVLGGAGQGFDALLGTNIAPTAQSMGEGIPRMVSEALLTVPEVASGAGAPIAAVTWANRLRKIGQAVGYGSSALKGYAETDSPVGAAISAASLYGGNKLFSPATRGGLDVGGEAADAVNRWLGKKVGDIDMASARTLLGEVPTPQVASAWERLAPVGARVGADVATGTALNEATRQAQMSVGPNAMPWDAPERNPLTPENITSNVLGSAMFAPSAITAFRERPSFVPKQVEQVGKWVQERDALLQRLDTNARTANTWEGPVDSATYRAYFGDKKIGPDFHTTDLWAPEDLFAGKGFDKVPSIEDMVGTHDEKVQQGRSMLLLKTQFDALRQQTEEGSHDYAAKTRESIANLLESDPTGNLAQAHASMKAMDAQVRLSPPEDIKGFGRFVHDYNDLIDTINENTHETLTDEEKTKANLGKTWHPNARDPLVVSRLEEKGLLPRLTPESLKSDFNAEFDQTGNAQFAYQVVLQKAVNRTLDRLPAALEQEKAIPSQVTTDYSPKVQKARLADDNFVNALNSLQTKAPELWDDLLSRTKAVFSRGARIAERGNMSGRLVDEVSSYRKAVIQAAETYDPVSKTVMMKGKTGYQRTSLSTLVGKDENGKYYWYPHTSVVPIGEGGKPAKTFGGKTVPETNLEDLSREQGAPGTGESLDEQEFRQAVEAEQAGTTLKSGELPTKVGIAAGEERVPETGAEVPDFLKPEGAQKKAQTLQQKKTAFDKGLAALDDKQLYRLSQEVFDTIRPGALPSKDRLRYYRENGALRPALQAVFESLGKGWQEVGPAGKTFLEMERARGKEMRGSEGQQLQEALRVFFGSDVIGKVGQIAKKVGDPRAVELVKRGTLQVPAYLKKGGTFGPGLGARGSFDEAAAASNGRGPTREIDLPNDVASRLLSWKKPVPEQLVQNIATLLEKHGEGKADQILSFLQKRSTSGQVFYETLSDFVGSEQKATKVLRDAGVSGLSHGYHPVSNAESNFTLFDEKGAGGLKTMGAEPQTGTVLNQFANTTPPGSFVKDVHDSLNDSFYRLLGERGYSGTLRELYTNMGVALAKTLDGVPVDFYRTAQNDSWGLAGTTGTDNRAKLGLNTDPFGQWAKPEKFLNRIIDVLGHEIQHIDSMVLNGLIDAPDAFSTERRRQLENFHALAEVLTPDEREAILTTLTDTMLPKAQQRTVSEPGGRRYGTNDPEEFTAEVGGLLVRSLLHGTPDRVRTVLETLDYSPTEVREFSQGTFRTIYDVLQGMKDSVTDVSARQTLGLPALASTTAFTSEALHAVINAAREGSLLRDGDRALMQARATVATFSEGAATSPPLPSPAMWYRTAEELNTTYSPVGLGHDVKLMPSATDAIAAAKDFLNRPGDPTKGMQPGLWARWFYPFAQLMFSMERAGAPLARPVANLAMDLQPGITRTRSALLRPFTIVTPDGHIKFDQDNILIKKLSEEKTGPWRDAVNKVSAWQQENGTQSMFVRDEKTGQIVVNPDPKLKADQAWDKIRGSLSLDDQQVVQGTSTALDETSQIAAQRLVASIDVSNRMRVASLLMAIDRRMPYEQAKAMADGVTGALLKGDVLSAQRTIPDPKMLGQVTTLLTGPDGLLAKFNEVQQKLLNRPGFRTESLPGDFVLRFKTPEGQIKYLSADTKHKANWLARKLTGEGNVMAGEIVNKSELRDYADFDSPDSILQKFTEVEGDVWDKFVGKMQAQHGEEFGAALRDYSPGATTMRELTTKGMSAFTTERQSKVDRSRYDYIDGTMSWVSRLATSMEYRATRQMKDLILNDPRAKAFPTFKGLVDPHFDNLMSPTSQLAKEMKTFTSAYFLGGSLGSAIMNGTQSVTSLVPTLIQLSKSGGPVEAYATLGRATAKAAKVSMSDDWVATARDALQKDPSKWTLEESQATLYKRSIEDGGINHGIIQDNIFTGTDQRTIMTAKFGRGDYGPVTKGEMARNGVYLASQLALKPFGWIESLNNKVALFSGIEQGYSAGLRGEDLYQHAKLVKTLSTYGGGKANVPGLVPKLSTPYTRSAVGVVNTLQQYGYGAVASYAQLVKDSLGKSQRLSPLERRQAQKAFGTMFATQVALGGALGLPFAAASLTLLEKLFGIPANQLVRQGLAALGPDEDSGAVIAETALNGIGNQMFGLDVSSRLGVSNILGTSAYRGFNLQDMVGPVGSIVANAAEALNWFGQGEPVKAAQSLVPNALRNAVELSDTKAKYGDYGMRDAGGNLLYQPSTSQAAAYLLGFRPREVSQKRQAEKMLAFADQRSQVQRGKTLDDAGRSLLAGDPTSAMTFAQNARFADPTVDPKSILRSVVERAVDSITEKDLLASGPASNEGERSRIAGTFGQGVVTRQSEVQRAQLSAQLGAQLGLVPQPAQFAKASLVDMLVQTRGMPRSQAVRLAEFLQ